MRTPEQLYNATITDAKGTPLMIIRGRSLVDGHIKVLDKTRTPWAEQFEAWATISEFVADGIWNIEQDGDIPLSTLPARTKADDEKLKKAQGLLSEVEALKRKGGASNHAAITSFLGGKPSETKEFVVRSRATIYRLLGRQRKGLPLLIGDAAKGNRKPRYTPALIELIEDELDEKYLQEMSKWTLTALTERITYLARDQKLLPADKWLSRDFVSRVLHSISADPAAERMRAEDRPAGKSIAKQQIRVGGPLRRVEQDALHLPFVVRTPWGVSREVWLVHSIDCYLSWPVAWYLVIGNPRQSDSLRCVERALFRKTKLLESFGIDADRDLFGTMVQLIFDNGPETKGDRMMALARLGIKPMYCKARHAHGKPFIERLNKSLKKYLETLDGCTRFEGKDGVRDPVALGDELMDIDKLEQWIVDWYFKIWVDKPLKRLRSAVFRDEYKGRTPLEVRDQVIKKEGLAIPLPPNRTNWDFIQFEQVTPNPTLSRKTGITVDTFDFAGDNLPDLIERVGETQVTVLKDPDDFRWVEVVLDGERVRLVNKDVDENTPAHSFAEAKKILKELPPAPTSKEAEDLRRAALGVGRHGVDPAAPKPRGARKQSQQTTARSRHDEAVGRAAESPLKTPPPTEQASAQPSTAANEGTNEPKPQPNVWGTWQPKTFETTDSGPTVNS